MKKNLLVLFLLSSLASADQLCVENYFNSRVGEKLDYQVDVDGIRAKGFRSLIKSESDVFQFTQSVSILIASLEEESDFITNEIGVVPLRYRFEQLGLGSRKTEIDFIDSTAQVFRKGVESNFALTEGFQDPLTFILQLQAKVNCNPSIETLVIPLAKQTQMAEAMFVKDEQIFINSGAKNWGLQVWQRIDGKKVERVGLIPELNNLLFSYEQIAGEKINRIQLIDLPLK